MDESKAEKRSGWSKVEITRERMRTVRYLAVCAVVALCVWRISTTIERVFDQPAWVTVVLSVISCLIGPSGLAFFVIRRLMRGAAERRRLIREYQIEKDKDRSTSGLLPDGTDPKD
jgi:hypothetical protein